MAKVVDFIEDNLTTVNKLAKIGVLPLCFMQDYSIYKMYLTTAELKPMKRYDLVSKTLKVSVSSVRKAKYLMEKEM